MADSATTPAVKNTVELEADVNVEFNEATSRQQINSGESVKTLFGKLRKFLADLKAVAFSGAYGDLSGTPDLTQYASKSKYGDTTINVGRKAGTAGGIRSTAEGYNTTASGDYSHAEGASTTASGNRSHAEGYLCTASSGNSHAEGNNTTASGTHSHSEGDNTIASGIGSHAGGASSIASSDYSFAHGMHVESNNSCEVSLGKFNKSSSDTLFSIGDGTADSARHNAFEITKTGGKLHDKDIATTDLIPTELPANGGNADTLDGVHASDFVRAFNGTEMTINRIPIPNDVHVGNWLAANARVGMCYYINSDNKGLTGLPDGNVSWAWFIFNGADYVAKTIDDRFFYMNYINSYSGWSEIYTSKSKPYVTGSVTVAANSTTCTSNHGFTPSAVIWWDGNYSGVAMSFNGTQFTIDKTRPVDRIISYLIFK